MSYLKDPKVSYLLSSSERMDNLISYLYSRDYRLLDIKGYYDNVFDDCVFAFSNLTNDELRTDALRILEGSHQESLIIKYRDDINAKRIFKDGQEIPLSVILYNTDSNNKSYIHDGVSFSFVEGKNYSFPKGRKDFKNGMIVELFSNKKWVEKKVIDVDSEYEKMYNLLIKYNKIRIAS